MSIDRAKVIVVMDAHCALCSEGARWIAANDANDEFRIVPLHTQLGQHLMLQHGVDPSRPDTWLLVHEGRALIGIDAWLYVSKRLNARRALALALWLIPRPIRNVGYRFVALNRIRFFGRDDLCNLPSPEVARRLVQ